MMKKKTPENQSTSIPPPAGLGAGSGGGNCPGRCSRCRVGSIGHRQNLLSSDWAGSVLLEESGGAASMTRIAAAADVT